MEAWQAFNPTASILMKVIITLAGTKLEEKGTAAWWMANREELKKLASWLEFASKVRLNFVRPNWKMDQLADFYAVHQGLAVSRILPKTHITASPPLASVLP